MRSWQPKARSTLSSNMQVYHRDLKPENLLLDENGNLKVLDFGLSAVPESKRQDGFLHTVCGTPAYVAPEVINRKGYDGAKADIWSCGVILYVMLTGHHPFRDSNLMLMYKKMQKANYKCPNWFPPEVCKLLSKILDPDSDTRILTSKIMDNCWVRNDWGTKPLNHKIETKERAALDVGASFGHNENNRMATGTKQELAKITKLNAFDIISLSAGFDLSCLLVDNGEREHFHFTSQKHDLAIISKLEEIAACLRMKLMKKDGGFLRLLGSAEVGKFAVLIDVDIFEFASSFYLVEIKKSNGDTLEYQKLLKQYIRPALEDIVCVWLDDRWTH